MTRKFSTIELAIVQNRNSEVKRMHFGQSRLSGGKPLSNRFAILNDVIRYPHHAPQNRVFIWIIYQSIEWVHALERKKKKTLS